MKKILVTLLSLLIAYVTWRIYKQVTDWKFFIAFMGGGIDAYILYAIIDIKTK
ncbi:hypothetical protein [Clostridium botulinum]|uniref:Uncharacterized protein n=1 Tax=Clostridium botulinum (strain 657 / Type Ba4) TaxID=515621 RepID=A0A3F2ZTP3_CLOB6|nr:hypothetical protein [Clostridium botulinum]ACQ51205.1 hypothetical protein CLJ_0107 [Clostridium botulinum Ba4 str. 657]